MPSLGDAGTSKPGYSKKAIKIQCLSRLPRSLAFQSSHCHNFALSIQGSPVIGAPAHWLGEMQMSPNLWPKSVRDTVKLTLDLNRNTAIFLCDASTDRQRSWKRIMFTAKTDKDLF